MLATVEEIARVCHEACRAIQQVQMVDPERWHPVPAGLKVSPPWDDLEEDQREMNRAGVRAALRGVTVEQMHEAWVAERTAAGWTWGLVRSDSRKEHPNLVPYAELPASQVLKDEVFLAIVQAMS